MDISPETFLLQERTRFLPRRALPSALGSSPFSAYFVASPRTSRHITYSCAPLTLYVRTTLPIVIDN